VLLAIAVFALSWPAGAILRRRHRPAPVLPAAVDDDDLAALHVVVTEGHTHQHHPGCGHREVQHGDHTDFIHEGHRHAAHADHYDEH